MNSIKELEGMTYTEYINMDNAHKIVQNWEDILQKLPKNRRDKIMEQKKVFDPLVHLKKILKDKKDIIHTKYAFSKSLKTAGRLFAQNSSLQGLPREIRNALAFGKYYDIDMKNAHPTILYQYCKSKGIGCEYLEKYVKNREVIINEISKDNNIPAEGIKQKILKALNGGYTYNYKSSFLDNFVKEIKTIHTLLCNLNPAEYKKVKNRKEYNAEGSMVNVILCREENTILMNSVLFMKEEGYNVDVLVFDGFMVRKGEKELTEDVLLKLNKYILDKTGYNITFVEKSIDNILDLSTYPEPIQNMKLSVSYYKDKEEFEKTHLKITHPPLYITQFEDGTMNYQSRAEITDSYLEKKSTIENDKGEVEKVSFMGRWVQDEYIRKYEKMVFLPPPCEYDNRYYNTWTDFRQEKVKLPDNFNMETNDYIKQYKQFIHNLFNGVEEYINYYDAWCANMIQRPANRSSICLVLYSKEEGVGKNMSTQTLEKCIGTNYVNYITDVQNQLFGKHSSAEMNKLLIVLNEVKGKDTYANTDLFKTRITDATREVELKGKEMMQITNYCSYILNTNNINSVNAGDKDRRFCVIPCINKKIDDKKYFNDYQRNINDNPEAIRCIYEYLKQYDITKIVPDLIFASVRPKTEIYKDLQECNKDKEWDFLEEIVIENMSKKSITIELKDMWEKYKSFCRLNNYDFSKLPSKRFHCIFSQTIITSLNNKEEYKDAIEKGRKTSAYYLKFDIERLVKYFKLNEYEDDGLTSNDKKYEDNYDDNFGS